MPSKLVRFYEASIESLVAKAKDAAKQKYDQAKRNFIEKSAKEGMRGFDDALATWRKHVETPLPVAMVKEWRSEVEADAKAGNCSYDEGNNAFYELVNGWIKSEPDGRAWWLKNNKTAGKPFLF